MMYNEDRLGLLAHTFNLSNVGTEVGGAPLTPGQPALLMISRPSRLHRETLSQKWYCWCWCHLAECLPGTEAPEFNPRYYTPHTQWPTPMIPVHSVGCKGNSNSPKSKGQSKYPETSSNWSIRRFLAARKKLSSPRNLWSSFWPPKGFVSLTSCKRDKWLSTYTHGPHQHIKIHESLQAPSLPPPLLTIPKPQHQSPGLFLSTVPHLAF